MEGMRLKAVLRLHTSFCLCFCTDLPVLASSASNSHNWCSSSESCLRRTFCR